MKISIFSVVIAGIFFSSCSQFDEPKYSCDKTIDSWVKDNLNEIRVMSRGDWMGIEDDFQRPVYRAFTPEQKFNFWMTKFEEVLQLEWTMEEKMHINRLIEFVEAHREMFCDGDVDEVLEDEIDLFQYQWCEYAQTEFDWNNKVIYAIAATGKKMLATDGAIDGDINNRAKSVNGVMQHGSETGSGYIPECSCSKESYFCYFLAFGQSGVCKDAKCKETDGGCGFMWWKDCDGQCFPDFEYN